MALNTNTYSGKEFAVYIASDDVSSGAGTFNDQASEFRRLDVEGVTLPSFSPNQEFEMRTGSGRVAEYDQVFSSTKRVITEFTLSGRLTTLDLPIWLENVLSKPGAAGSNRTKITIPSGYNVGTSGAALTVKTHVGTEVTSIAGEGSYEHTLSVAFVSPSSADGYKFSGCVVTSLTLDADMDSASGRFNYSATLQTAFQPTKGNMSTSVAIGGSKVFLSDLATKNMNIQNASHADADDTAIDPFFKTFNLSIENPTQFLGSYGTSGNPQLIAKAVPELSITIGGSVKYDDETDLILESHRDATSDSYLQFNMADIAWSSYAFADTTSSAGFGVGISKAKFTSAEVTSDDLAMVNFEAKALDDGTNAVLEVVTD